MNKIELDKFKPFTHLKYRADIDGLRAIAVLAVVGFHAFPEYRIFVGGFIGVDIFFVISGFLISTILFQNFEQDNFSLIEFYKRRILRIFPTLIVVLTSCLVIGSITLFANEFKQIGKHTAAGVAFVSNLVLWNESGYFNNSANSKPLQHLWSLGIEEQFYLVWPLLLWATYKRRINVLITIVVITIISFSFNIYMVRGSIIEAFFSPLTRFWELLIGSLLAHSMLSRVSKNYTNSTNDQESLVKNNLLSLLGLILLGVGFRSINEWRVFPGYWALLPTIGTALIISAGSNTFINSRILSNRILVWFGLISYPLYLWHWPILTFLRIFEGSFREISIEKRVFAVCISIILAWATYYFIEKPIRFGNHKNKKSFVLLFLISIVGMIGWQINIHDGYAERIKFEPKKASVLFEKYPHQARNTNCENIYPELIAGSGSAFCLLSDPKEAEIALVGDSHAHMYYQELSRVLDKKTVLNFSYPSCLPFASEQHLTDECNVKQKAAIDFLVKHHSIKTVYLSGYFSYLSAGGFKYGNIDGLREARELDNEQEQTFVANGINFIQKLKDAGKDIILIKDVPDIIFRPTKCVHFESDFLSYIRSRGKLDQSSPNECVIDKANYEIRNRPYENALTKILNKFSIVRIFDPRKILCDNNRCYIIKNGIPLYWDSDHLTIEGSKIIIEELIKLNPPAT
jgi:peptidoglycan/LPS O-acetylase OafA/YrhL